MIMDIIKCFTFVLKKGKHFVAVEMKKEVVKSVQKVVSYCLIFLIVNAHPVYISVTEVYVPKSG